MHKNLIVWIVVLLFSVGVVSAFTYCDDIVQPNVTCQLVTPVVVGCDVFNYSIVNESGDQVEAENLTGLYGSVYYLNFSQAQGRYVVELCDGSTKQIKAGEDESMVLAALILLPIIFGFLLLRYLGNLDDDHKILKNLLGMFAWFGFVISLHFGAVVLLKYYGFVEMLRTVTSTTYMIVIVFIFVFCYWMIYYIKKTIDAMMAKKAEKLRY